MKNTSEWDESEETMASNSYFAVAMLLGELTILHISEMNELNDALPTVDGMTVESSVNTLT